MEDTEFINVVNSQYSYSDICRALNKPTNGNQIRIVKANIARLGLSVSHFKSGNWMLVKYPIIEKICPVCDKPFKAKQGHKREKMTCSYACSNTHFRSGSGNGKYEGKGYRDICFRAHGKKCVVCAENKVVAVHHYDGNHKNNEPANLIPLCPTHHCYVHSRYISLVRLQIEQFRNKYLTTFK